MEEARQDVVAHLGMVVDDHTVDQTMPLIEQFGRILQQPPELWVTRLRVRGLERSEGTARRRDDLQGVSVRGVRAAQKRNASDHQLKVGCRDRDLPNSDVVMIRN